ncbi:MAG: DUF885 family protein [Pyrinomonadaceae bacterium]
MKLLSAFIFLSVFTLSGFGQAANDLSNLNESPSRLRGAIEKFREDYGSIDRFYTSPVSSNRAERLRKLYTDWEAFLAAQKFDALNHDEQIDYLLFKNFLAREKDQLSRYDEQLREMSSLIPFARAISDLEDSRRRLETIDSAKTAKLLDELNTQITALQQSIKANKTSRPKRTVANRAAGTVGSLRRVLGNWYGFYTGYDPQFSWWNSDPYKTLDETLKKYQAFISEELVGIKADDKTTIIGDPIGRESLIKELGFEMIPYSPEELVEIANKEFAWCEAEMKKASREMGYGDDWMKALEAVKNKYVEPGKQAELIRDQAYEAIEFVEKNDLVTVPALMKESWRMEMMSPARQLVSPFFLGGETILVSYPTDSMTHEQKMMSMRGNNPHFTRAVTHHELIPGHHMQRYSIQRHRPYRSMFYTPFWMEGWALYWEFLLWDKDFIKTPEDKVGALFWRMHRSARIIFSLNFHLEKMTPQEAVDLLVNRVGHERDNATAEVRRSFAGNYGPLYQIAYMMGGLQFYNLHRELVDSKKMTDKEFHDRILHEGPIPVEMVRAILTNQKMTNETAAKWRFYGGLPN